MNIIATFVLFIAGTYFVVFHRKVVQFMVQSQIPKFKKMFGESIINWESKYITYFYTFWSLLVGILLLIGAFAVAFGPIQL